MNSLNILTRSRDNSTSDADWVSQTEKAPVSPGHNTSNERERGSEDGQEDTLVDEKTPLLGESAGEAAKDASRNRHGWRIHRRIAEAVFNSVKVVIATITAPGRYLLACFYDEDGHFSAILPLMTLGNLFTRKRRKSAAVPLRAALGKGSVRDPQPERRHSPRPSTSAASIASSSSSDGEGDPDSNDDSPAKHTRSRSVQTVQQRPPSDSGEPRKSIRIQVQDDSLRRRKAARGNLKRLSSATSPEDVATVASALKSPSSPSVTGKLTRYPRSPAPPRPLVPRRQPSYSLSNSSNLPKKTLVIDLDETLIHSMAKGGRMSTGHMVEVKLGGPVTGPGLSIGPGVPILYFVHERPGCHDFLRKVCRWYDLVVFTASVQEYADPVIDWLERERKYFSRRYYRQHCTFRNGAYIKDLAQIEPDLSRVMILDNSPMSYVFHEDNAIPIEGWISDPTDNDLLHLIPVLEGLQYVTDVRALLALRQGQAQQA